VEVDATQRVLGLEDFIAEDDEAERRAFELVCRLSELEAEAARQPAVLDARTDITLLYEYEQWQAKQATRRIKEADLLSRRQILSIFCAKFFFHIYSSIYGD
jgi:hypothetical protein